MSESSQPGCGSPAHAKTFEAIIPGATQKVTLSTSHAESTVVGTGTTVVQLCSDVDCWFRMALAPVAVNTDTYLPAKTPRIYGITPGWKISAIAGGAGNLYVTEGA